MKFSPDLLKAADHCQHRSFITNRYTGARIAVDCGQCDYCIHKRAQKASMRVKTAGSAFKHSFFVTLTFDNEHIPLMNCKVLHSEYEDVVGISGDIHFGDEYHHYIPVSEYQCDDSSALYHIYFEQVQGTVPFDREIKKYVPIKDNWFLSMDAIRSFIRKSQSVDNSPYPAAEKYGLDNLIPFLNYVDVQNYIKRLRKHLFKKLGSYETLHFYAVGEYGPVHFRPHFHLVLCTNSDEVAKVLRHCHDKSWNLGRSDFQRAAGGASSYVASYVNSLCSAPLLYRSCRAFRPRSRASIGFFEKGHDFVEDEDPYAQIERKIDSVVNGRIYNFNGISVRSTPPMSYIRALLPRFSSARNDDGTSIARILRVVHSTPARIARFGFIDYKQDSVLSLVRTYYKYLKSNPILTDDDKIILHASRCLTRFCNSSSDVDVESYINKLYRLFLYVSKFFRDWHLPPFGSDLSAYSGRIMFILKTGIEYEKKADYVRMCDSLRVQQTLPAPMLRYFYVPAEGCEMATIGIGEDGEYADGFIRPIKEQIQVPFDDPRIPSLAACNYIKSAKPDTRSAYDSGQSSDLQKCLDSRAATFCRDMIKHKKLNDANNIFNRMV
uniref:Replication associated protein n=1 Tax=Microviridae sp. ctJby12 TaxID=2827622 RepID=A0A8S5LMX0_9VIRU|nr:MAG TPA: Replication associated protein [Microviridae sp. ctJby12]